MRFLFMDLYRLLKSKSTYIITGILFVIVTALSLFIIKIQDLMFLLGGQQAMDEFNETLEESGGMPVLDFMSFYSLPFLFLPLFLLIITCLLISSEFQSGSIKNTYPKQYFSLQIVLSKIAAVAIWELVVMGLLILPALLCCALVHNFSLGCTLPELIRMMAMHWFVDIAFASFLVCIGCILRSTAATLTVAFVIHFTKGMALGVADMLLHKIKVPESFNLSEYTISAQRDKLAISMSGKKITEILVITGCWLAVTLLISEVNMKHRDI